MKFSGREDIKVAQDAVYAHLTDFATHERAALRRGVVVNRIDGLQHVGPGMTWVGKTKFRGKQRNVTLELLALDPCDLLSYRLDGGGLAGTFDIELMALSKSRTRMNVALEVRPKNLTGRLLMQSLRILKPTLNKRFRARLASVAGGIEEGLK